MDYEILLFDVDNTLLDFDANEAESFKNTIMDKGLEYTQELYETYKELNHQMWIDAENGKLTVDEVLNTRFEKLMVIYNIQVDGAEFEKTYRSYLNTGIQEMPHVHPVLKELKQTHRLYIITNGLTETQIPRLRESGLDQYFEKVFISEEVGAAKPSEVFFNHVKENIENFNATKALVIGDSLTADIRGGNQAGMDTCWLCTEDAINNTTIKPNYIIHSLTDLSEILS